MKLIALNKVCKIQNGYAFKSKDFTSEGIPLLRISNFDDGDVFIGQNTVYVEEKYLQKKSDFKVEKGDVLIALSGATTGKYGVYNFDFPSLLNQRVGLLKSGLSKDLSSNYFYYYLNILRKEILRNAGGAAQPNISTKAIGELKIPLPPLETQKKIAHILDEADKLRQLDKKLIEKYDALGQSLFLDMFGDLISNSKSWEVFKLSQLTTKLGDGIHGTPNYCDNGDYYFVNGNNLNCGVIEFNEKTKKVSKDEYLKHKKDLNSTTMLVSINGTIGKVAFYNNEKIMLGKSACYFNVNLELVNKIFLFYVINSPYFIRYASNAATGSTIKNVSLKTMRNLPVPLPSIGLQNQFAEKIAIIEQQRQQAQQSLEKSEELFNSLLQKAFKGELV